MNIQRFILPALVLIAVALPHAPLAAQKTAQDFTLAFSNNVQGETEPCG